MKINQYIKRDSPVHNLNSGLKYLMYIIIILSVPFLELRNELALILLINILVIVAKIPLGYFTKRLWIVPVITLMSSLFVVIFPSFEWTYLITVGLRVYIMYGFLLLIMMSTAMNDLVYLTYSICSFFTTKRKAQQYTLVVMLVINFIPIFITEISKINISLKAKGINIFKGKLKKKVSNAVIFFKILLYRIDNLIDEYDLILHGRNINITNVDNVSKKQKITVIDLIFVALCLLLIYV